MQIGHNVSLTLEEIQDAIAIRAIEAFEAKNPGVKLDRVSLMRGLLKVFVLDKEGKALEPSSAMITWTA